MVTDILLAALAVIVLLIATVHDLKTKEIPDFLNFSFLGIALVVRFLHALIFMDWLYFLYGVLGAGAMFFTGMLLYYARQWGGGDAKLLMGLGAAFATTPFFVPASSLFLVDMLVNIFVVGAVYGLLQAVKMFHAHFAAARKEMKRSLKVSLKIQILNLGLAAAIFIVHLFMPLFLKAYFIGVAVFLVVYTYLYLFVKAVEKVCMFQRKKLKEVTEGDWIADVYSGKHLVLKATPLGVTKKQLLKLRQADITNVLVKEGIAFAPAIFFGVVLTLWLGNVFFLLL